MKIFLGSDHRGVTLKNNLINYLQGNGIDASDIGIPNSDSDNYTDFAFKLGEMVRDTEGSLGILICGNGVGMSIAANKVKGVRCVRAVSVDDAFAGKNHNGANVLALGADTTSDINLVYQIVDTFVNTKSVCEERHQKRVDAIIKYEEEN